MNSIRDFKRNVYLSIFFLVYLEGAFFVNQSHTQPKYVLFAWPLQFLPTYECVYYFFFLGTLGLSFVSAIVDQKWIRGFAAVFFLVLFSIKFSFGKINHSHHIWFWVLPLFVFFAEEKSITWNQRIVDTLRVIFLSILFCSGLWKMRSLNLNTLSLAPLEHFSFAILEGNGPSPDIQYYLLSQAPWILVLGFYVVLIYQLSCILPVIFKWPMKYWGVGALVFHTLTGLFLGIWFKPFVLFVLLFFIIWDDKDIEVS